MRLKKELLLSETAGEYYAVPMAEAAKAFTGLIRLNKTGFYILKKISEGMHDDEIAAQLVTEFEGVDQETALRCVRELIEKLGKEGLLED